MDAPAATPSPSRFNHFLPYAAVFQADVKQTLRSWIYRLWAFLSVAVTSGYLIYRFGAKREAGIMQPAPEVLNDLISWIIWGSVTLIIVLTAGAISGERGNLGDSILCRGISRIQYFMGKWHSRLFVILTTFVILGVLAMSAAILLLHSEMVSWTGSLVALAVVAALLVMIVTCGVTISALSSTTVVSITLVWMALYGFGFLLSLLPAHYPSPDRALQNLPNVLRGNYDLHVVSRLISGALSMSLLMGVIGMVGFSRKDV